MNPARKQRQERMEDLILYCQRNEIPFPPLEEIAASWRYAPSVVEKALWDASKAGTKLKRIGYTEWFTARAKMEELEKLFDGGLTWLEVEGVSGISRHTFRKWRLEFGVVKNRQRKHSEEVCGLVRDLWVTTDLTIEGISAELDIEPGSVCTILSKLRLFPRREHRREVG